ncbi:MAG: virulence factor [Planctomycetes bacterium]|nr:virulence factor [Planctomycetota bacterium]
MYAVAFDLDTDILRKTYGNDSYNNAYGDIKKLLTTKHGFNWQQGSVYFGDPAKVNAVSCVLAIMDVSRTFSWFAQSVRDIRMLRIEEQNNLMDAVQQAASE